MVQELDDLKLAGGSSLTPLAFFLRIGLGNRVLTDAAEHVLERDMLGQAVLVAGAIR